MLANTSKRDDLFVNGWNNEYTETTTDQQYGHNQHREVGFAGDQQTKELSTNNGTNTTSSSLKAKGSRSACVVEKLVNPW